MRFIFSLTFLLLTSCAQAQRVGKLTESSLDVNIPFTIRTLGTEDGIPQNQISVLTTDENNNLILGTANGYARFNGQEFTPISNNERTKWVFPKKIHYDKRTKRVSVINHTQNEYLIAPKLSSLSQNLFIASTFYKDSIFGISKNGTIYSGKIGTGKYQKLLQAPKISIPFFSIGFIDEQLFIGSAQGSYLYVNKKWKKISSRLIYTSKQNPYTKTYYILSYDTVYLYKNKKLKPLELSLPKDFYEFTDIAFSPHNEIFISSHKGLYYMNEEYGEFFTCAEGMPSQALLSLQYNVQENILFIGSGDRGLLQLKIKECVSFYNAADLSEASLSSIIKTQRNEIIVAGTSNRIYRFGWNSFSPFFTKKTNFSALANIDNQIWAGTWGAGVYILNNDQLVDSIPAKLLPSGTIHAVFKDQQNRTWIGTANGASYMDKKKKKVIHFDPRRIRGEIICFKQLKNGDLIIAGENGISCYSGNLKFNYSFTEKNGLFAKEVRAIHEIKPGHLLIGTYGGGLYYLRNKELIAVNKLKNCLLDIDVFTLAPDFLGNLYLSSNHGLYIVKEKDIVDFATGKKAYLIPFKLGQNDGILNTEFNGGFQNNYYRNNMGHFYFPSIQGVVVSYFTMPDFRKLAPQIDEVYVNDKKINLQNSHFTRETHTVKMKFHCTNFTSFYNLNYQYKLVGPDLNLDWSALSNEGEVSFKMLPPGKYTVFVRGVDGFNDANPIAVKYEFQIAHYFFETLLFKVITVAILFLFLFYLVYKRIHFLKQKELKESEIQHNLTELKLNAIQSKMNPHFIFNCLNNIQNLIVLGKSEEAQQAMSDFSALLRRFLQQSENTFVQLNEELQLLKAYLAVEKFRFEDELNITFDIPTHLGFYYIPTLLIQPTVENAIIHGLNHKKGEKNIRIQAILENESLSIYVDDDGVGREVSRKINSSRKGHVSHGSKIIWDKIELLKERYGYSITFETIDKPNHGGTRVKFTFPLVSNIDSKN